MANAPKPGRSKISESANLTERLPGPVELSPFKCTDFVLAELLFNLQGRQSLLDRTAGVKTAILAVTPVCKLVRTCKPTGSGDWFGKNVRPEKRVFESKSVPT